MKQFVALFDALDSTTSTQARVAAMVRYFASAPPADAAWTVWFLSGQRPRRLVSSTELRSWALDQTGMAPWLFEECYASVGDLAETIALLVDDGRTTGEGELLPMATWMEARILALREVPVEARGDQVRAWWATLGRTGILLLNKMLTGGFRVGVSRTLVERALAQVADLPQPTIAHRLMGNWEPSGEAWQALMAPAAAEIDPATPYPFCLAHAVEEAGGDGLASLGAPTDWAVEWKWDGIRAQVIRRAGQHWVWSRGEELLNDRFPEVEAVLGGLPDGTVLDGELLVWDHEAQLPQPFAVLQTRIGRKTLSKRLLAEAPVVLLAYDLLEDGGQDIRTLPYDQRRARLVQRVQALDVPQVQLSPLVVCDAQTTWDSLAQLQQDARQRRVEGFMLKRLSSAYGVGRRRGDWWKWKVAPMTMDAVLLYAQVGHGRRANLYTDYTFAVWDDAGTLVPVCKAYSGLTDAEIRTLDGWIKQHTKERFGPVRSVTAHHVFEIAFEGIQASTRHKSGIAVRFPRIHRWRTDKKMEEADTLARLRTLLTPSDASEPEPT